jgi:hypothetical protein
MDFKQDKLHAHAHMVTPKLNVIKLLARLEQMKSILICLPARSVSNNKELTDGITNPWCGV